MLEIDSLSYTLKERTLLDAISFSLQEGENLIILGENGAGKSTLAKLLCGIIPSEKKVTLQGQYIEDIPPQKRAKLINYMPAKFSLFDPYTTVNDYLTLSTYKRYLAPKRIEQILSLVQLSAHQNHYASTLSSGEQQLLLLASSALQGAAITIFDEPTSNLDPKKTKRLFEIVKKSEYFKQKIVITHNLQFAYSLAYPVLYLEDAKIRYFENNFFRPKNLADYYHDTIMMEGDYIVERL